MLGRFGLGLLFVERRTRTLRRPSTLASAQPARWWPRTSGDGRTGRSARKVEREPELIRGNGNVGKHVSSTWRLVWNWLYAANHNEGPLGSLSTSDTICSGRMPSATSTRLGAPSPAAVMFGGRACSSSSKRSFCQQEAFKVCHFFSKRSLS